jgi:hypothetical protein
MRAFGERRFVLADRRDVGLGHFDAFGRRVDIE